MWVIKNSRTKAQITESLPLSECSLIFKKFDKTKYEMTEASLKDTVAGVMVHTVKQNSMKQESLF